MGSGGTLEVLERYPHSSDPGIQLEAGGNEPKTPSARWLGATVPRLSRSACSTLGWWGLFLRASCI